MFFDKILNLSRTFLRGIRPRRKDFFNTHLFQQQAAGYSGKVRDLFKTADFKLFRRFALYVLLYETLIIILIFCFKYYSLAGGLFKSFVNPFYFLIQWDSHHYLNIALHGFESYNSAFWPIYPLLIYIGSLVLFNNSIIAGFTISWLSLALSLFYFYKLLEAYNFSSILSKKILLLLLFGPFAIFFSSIYTESIFLFFILASFYYLKKDCWLKAAIFGALAALTRCVGIFLFPVYLFHYWEKNRFKIKKELFYSILVPFALGLYFSYCYLKFGNFFSPIIAQENWPSGRHSYWPWQVMSYFYNIIFTNNLIQVSFYDFNRYIIIEFGSFLLCLVTGVYLFLKKYYSFAIFCLLNAFLFSFFFPMTAINRYLVVIFPIYIFLALVSQKKEIIFIYIFCLSFLLFIFNAFLFINGNWVG